MNWLSNPPTTAVVHTWYPQPWAQEQQLISEAATDPPYHLELDAPSKPGFSQAENEVSPSPSLCSLEYEMR